MLSEETIGVCLELLSMVVLKPTEENADEKWEKCRKAVKELHEMEKLRTELVDANKEAVASLPLPEGLQ